MEQSRRHILMVAFPAQGHINPSLHFANKLISMEAKVTFATSLFISRKINTSVAKGVNFIYFSDGFDDGFKLGYDALGSLETGLRNGGMKALRDAIVAADKREEPVSCLVYSMLLPWASEVAHEFHLPVALLWIQPASVLGIYYYYFNGFQEEISSKCEDPNWKLKLPGYSYELSKRDIPSFLIPSTASLLSVSAFDSFKEQIECLEKETNPKILVNTFDELEKEILGRSFGKYELIGVGPLLPDTILRGKGFGFEKSNEIEWLSSKAEHSVVYISFGSMLALPKEQIVKIARGLLASKRPFLWVFRTDNTVKRTEEEDNVMEEIQTQSLGKIVPWCNQLEVLSHPSLGCFVSHCGWNSTLESMSCGVPIVAFPHWTDQGTNAKMIEEVWKVGVRVNAGEGGIVEDYEITRCIEQVMDGGEISGEVRNNAQKWKVLAREAVADEDGASYKNLKQFVNFGCKI